jgi:pentatricopeptide repeat protein
MGPGAIKAAKDIMQADTLIKALVQGRRHDELLEVWEEALGRGEGWRSRLLKGRARLDNKVQDLLPI